MSWLFHQRAYAERFYESVERQSELAQREQERQKGEPANIGIKF